MQTRRCQEEHEQQQSSAICCSNYCQQSGNSQMVPQETADGVYERGHHVSVDCDSLLRAPRNKPTTCTRQSRTTIQMAGKQNMLCVDHLSNYNQL